MGPGGPPRPLQTTQNAQRGHCPISLVLLGLHWATCGRDSLRVRTTPRPTRVPQNQARQRTRDPSDSRQGRKGRQLRQRRRHGGSSPPRKESSACPMCPPLSPHLSLHGAFQGFLSPPQLELRRPFRAGTAWQVPRLSALLCFRCPQGRAEVPMVPTCQALRGFSQRPFMFPCRVSTCLTHVRARRFRHLKPPKPGH